MLKNILTFDIEDWYHANFEEVDMSKWHTYESRVCEPTMKILKLLRETNSRATFFILGYIAERFPELIMKIKQEGHEIACHGYNHRLVYELTEHEFMQDITKAKKIIEAITEGTVIGYRAPSWSVCRYRTPWFWNVLRKTGFLYDASLFPFKTFLYGDNHNRPYFHAIRVDDGGKIYEIPGSVSIFCGLRIPFGGGFYFRFWPSWVIRFFIKRLNAQKQPAVIYLHPREVDIEQPRLKLNLRDYFIMYHNIHQADQKLEKILNRFTFTDIRHVYAELFNKN